MGSQLFNESSNQANVQRRFATIVHMKAACQFQKIGRWGKSILTRTESGTDMFGA